MRAIHLCDLVAATRALCAVHPFLRAAHAARLLERAHSADKWRRRSGMAHPMLGDGTLGEAARYTCGAALPAPGRGDWLEVLALLLGEIRRWRRFRQAPRGPRPR